MAEAAPPLPRVTRWRLPLLPQSWAWPLRSGIVVGAAIWLGKAPGLVENHSSWILITVLMLTMPTTGASLTKALLRAMGTVAAAFTAIALFGWFAQDPPLLMAGLFAVQVMGAYGFSGPRHQYAWFVFAFTTGIVLGNAMAGESLVENVAFRRASMVGLGILLVFVADALLWPVRAEPRLRAGLAERARGLAGQLRGAMLGLLEPRDEGAPAAGAKGGLADQLALAASAPAEIGVRRSWAAALERAAMLLEALDSRVRLLSGSEPPRTLSHPEAGPLVDAWVALARQVEAAAQELAVALRDDGAVEPRAARLEEALLDVEQARLAVAARVGPDARLEGTVEQLRDIVSLMQAVEETLRGTAPAATAAPESSDASPLWRRALAWRPDPDRTKIALRTGIAVVATLLVPMALGWPINTTVVPVCFMVAAVTTRGAALQSFLSLVVVALFGWGVADLLLVFVLPHLGRAPLGLLPAFLVMVAFCRVAARVPALAALPSVGGLIALLSTYGSRAAPTDVYGPYNTVCYVGLALLVGWLATRLLWPATAAASFRRGVARQLQLCLGALREAPAGDEPERTRRARGLLQASARGVLQLGTLHGQAVHEPVERALDPDRRERLLALAIALRDAVLGARLERAEAILERTGARFERLREALARADQALLVRLEATIEALAAEEPMDDARAAALEDARRELEAELDAIRADPEALAALVGEDRRRFLIALDARRRLFFRQDALDAWLEEWRRAEGVAGASPSDRTGPAVGA